MSELDFTVTELPDGMCTVLVQVAIRDDAPESVKDALAIRRTANATGACPDCGVTAALPNRAARRKAARRGGFLRVVFRHEDDRRCLTDDEEVQS
jgi:hypothetical protein